MNFRPQNKDQPELNLIPMIDVLIVLLIFLVMTTTFSRQTGLTVQLPDVEKKASESPEPVVEVVIDALGRFAVNGKVLADDRPETLREAMRAAAEGRHDPQVLVSADRATPHHYVMATLDAAGRLGFLRVTFAAHVSHEKAP
jgi:biopolymer transport protein ExbD